MGEDTDIKVICNGLLKKRVDTSRARAKGEEESYDSSFPFAAQPEKIKWRNKMVHVASRKGKEKAERHSRALVKNGLKSAKMIQSSSGYYKIFISRGDFDKAMTNG